MTPLLLSLDALTPIVEHTPRDQVHRSEGRGRGRMPSPGRTRGSSLGAFSIYLDPPADVLLAVPGPRKRFRGHPPALGAEPPNPAQNNRPRIPRRPPIPRRVYSKEEEGLIDSNE